MSIYTLMHKDITMSSERMENLFMAYNTKIKYYRRFLNGKEIWKDQNITNMRLF